MMRSIKDSLKSFFRKFPYVLLLILLISVPVNLIQSCVLDVDFEPISAAQMAEDPNGSLLKYTIYLLLSLLLSSIITMLYIGVMLLRKCDYDGVPVQFRGIFEKSLVLLPKVWVTQLLSGIIVSIGLMFFMLPGILLYYIFYMVPYAVVYTEEWGRRGLFMASRYPRKHGRKVVGIIIFDLIYRFAVTIGASVLIHILPFTGQVLAVFSAGVYSLQNLLFCIPFAVIGGLALSLPVETDHSGQDVKEESQKPV